MHMEYLLFKTIKGASFVTMSGSSFNIHELTFWNVLKPFLQCMLYCTHFLQWIVQLVLEHGISGTHLFFSTLYARQKKWAVWKKKSFHSCLRIPTSRSDFQIPLARNFPAGATGDLRRSYTQCDHCHAGAKLFRSYFVITSFRRQINSTYGFYTT